MTDSPATLEQLYQAFDGLHMEGGWHRRFPALWPEPRRNFLPHVWHYAKVKPILDEAGRLVGMDQAERRNLTLRNPVEGNIYATVRTLVAAYQMIHPGETAPSHRHTPNALRLILEGRGTHTIVNGKQVEMRPGDVLLTPSWGWHSHANAGDEDCYWIDVLDVPLVHLLEPMFFEPHPDGMETNVTKIETAPIAFRRADVLAQIEAERSRSGSRGPVSVTLGPAHFETTVLRMIHMPAGSSTDLFRTTANSVFAVVEGEGHSDVDGTALPWGFGDILAVPAWRPYTHHATRDSLLFQVSDELTYAKLGLLRTEPA